MKHVSTFESFVGEAKKSFQDIAKELVEIAAYYTDVDLSSDMTNAKKCDDRLEVIAFFRELKDMMKDEEPAKYKEFEKEATSFLMKYSIQESVVNESAVNESGYWGNDMVGALKHTAQEMFESITESAGTVGNISVEKTKGGWLLKTSSMTGRGTQVIAILDDQVKELVKILTEG